MATMNGKIIQISVNPHGGVPKRRVPQARITTNVVEGDKQRHLAIHGGPERAVCLFSYEVIRALQEEGHPIDCGTTGENLTVSGLDWQQVRAGMRFQIGQEVLLEITRETTPCTTIAGSFIDGYSNRIHHKRFPGESRMYAKVLREGLVREGDNISAVEE
jgi:MOSC domain-containing protein YiiM